ncbi:MAG: PadR family transcriptional regulator [Anaerolineaceae bacterium]|nr:PadR family transcriptional regulator [Anaerolineaceae bacterium]
MDIQKIRKRFIPMSETMFFILYSLRQERHGYGIMQYVEELTKSRITLGAGTIYQSISKLEHDGLITAKQEIARKKNYLITDIGNEILNEEARRIGELYEIVKELV